ncbi:MAG TPA: FHA domain-containing protein, partial [Planctomycetaceae bacterium]|nr:FHA domain-containing protein [Planctomycetaceae bacterium]
MPIGTTPGECAEQQIEPEELQKPTVSKIVAAQQEKTAVLPASFRLAVTGPEDRHATIHTVNAPFVLIGRARGCGLRLDHPAVSRRHLYLQAVLGRMYCIDLTGPGGTLWLDGRRDAHWLERDEAIAVGPYEVRLVDSPPSP